MNFGADVEAQPASPLPPSFVWQLRYEQSSDIVHVTTSGVIAAAPLPTFFADVAAAMRYHQAHRALGDIRGSRLQLTTSEILQAAPLFRELIPFPTDKVAIVFSQVGRTERTIRHALNLYGLRIAIFDRLELAITWLTGPL